MVWTFDGEVSMNKKLSQVLFLLLILGFTASCDMARDIEQKASSINKYEKIALNLIKDNQLLNAQIGNLEAEIEKLRSQNQFLQIQLDKSKGRKLASVAPVAPGDDQVDFDIYKWSPSQLLTMAETEFGNKNYDKSAQFFRTFMIQYPKNEKIDDRFLFQAGIAAFESGLYYEWALESMNKLISDYPSSKYYRGAKLWVGLSNLKLGRKDLFYETVEEFRKKYRNTPEWKILSFRYEEIVQRFKN